MLPKIFSVSLLMSVPWLIEVPISCFYISPNTLNLLWGPLNQWNSAPFVLINSWHRRDLVLIKKKSICMHISDKNNLFTWAQKLAFHQCTPSYSSIPFFTLSCSLCIEQHSPLASDNIFTCLSQAFVRPPFIWRTDHRCERNAFFSLKVLESQWDLFCLGVFFFLQKTKLLMY